jgi:NADP-dependent 3-hydroxy acid dehydrogenase YdfG
MDTNTVIVTGASSGVGLDAARGFLAAGTNVVLNARNAERLSAAAETLDHQDRIALVPGDIGNPQTGVTLVDTASGLGLSTFSLKMRESPG